MKTIPHIRTIAIQNVFDANVYSAKQRKEVLYTAIAVAAVLVSTFYVVDWITASLVGTKKRIIHLYYVRNTEKKLLPVRFASFAADPIKKNRCSYAMDVTRVSTCFVWILRWNVFSSLGIEDRNSVRGLVLSRLFGKTSNSRGNSGGVEARRGRAGGVI